MKFEQQMRLWGQRLFLVLFSIFCVAYPIAVTGVAFDVHPPFSLAWAGSALLFLEGIVLIIATSLRYGWLRGVCAGLIVITLSYVVEAVGVGTGFPFGPYRYTDVLFPKLPGNVPMAVMFAWVLIVFGAYGWAHAEKQRIGIAGVLLGAALATLLDLEIEPVAAHLEHYWEWLSPGHINYYGVPLANFAAWFVVAFVLLLLVNRVLFRVYVPPLPSSRLVVLTPRLLFGASLFMFGLVDITHGYYGAALLGVLAGLVVWMMSFMERKNIYA
ncbi:MAG: carotenoid biosynthesis protein [Ktedonobacteraceae bacterium]